MARKNDILSIYAKEGVEIREAGLFKGEAPIASAQGARTTPPCWTLWDVTSRIRS